MAKPNPRYWNMRRVKDPSKKPPKVGRPSVKAKKAYFKKYRKKLRDLRRLRRLRERGTAEDLTEREKQILLHVRWKQYTERYSPTIKEIAEFFGVSHATAYGYVNSLENKGRIETKVAWPSTIVHILFPRNLGFPWTDGWQFPPDVFYSPQQLWNIANGVRVGPKSDDDRGVQPPRNTWQILREDDQNPAEQVLPEHDLNHAEQVLTQDQATESPPVQPGNVAPGKKTE